MPSCYCHLVLLHCSVFFGEKATNWAEWFMWSSRGSRRSGTATRMKSRSTSRRWNLRPCASWSVTSCPCWRKNLGSLGVDVSDRPYCITITWVKQQFSPSLLWFTEQKTPATKSKHEALAEKKALLDKRLQDVQITLKGGKSNQAATPTATSSAAASATPQSGTFTRRCRRNLCTLYAWWRRVVSILRSSESQQQVICVSPVWQQ